MLRQNHESTPPASEIYEEIVNSLTSGVFAVDDHARVITANDASNLHLNLPPQRICPGVCLHEVEEAAPFVAIMQEMAGSQHAVSRREIKILTATGEKTIGVTGSLLKGPKSFNGVIFLFIDLTDLRRLERIAELNRQLAQIGELTAGVVHELRNPLSVLAGTAELLLRSAGEDQTLAKRLRTVMDEAAHMDRLIAQFLSFAKPFSAVRNRCAPEDIAARALELCASLAKSKAVTVSQQVGEDLPLFEVDQALMAQALSNLVRNAIEVSPVHATVDLVTRCIDGAVEYLVLDEGPGVHLALDQDPFNPFTSGKQGGTGLGLSIVHRIVTAHGGTVEYENRPTGGAAFKISLPV